MENFRRQLENRSINKNSVKTTHFMGSGKFRMTASPNITLPFYVSRALRLHNEDALE